MGNVANVAEPRYLLDTNILVYLASDPSPELVARVEREEEYLATSTLCVAEAMAGDRTDEEIGALMNLLRVVRPIAFDLPSAEAIRGIRYKRRRIDRFIAAHALAFGLTVVTNNIRDFSDVPGLRVENWVEAE